MTPVDLGIAALAVGLTGVVVAWVGRPLWRSEPPLPPPDPRAVALLARRQAALAALRDLEADRASGRLDEDAYVSLRAEMTASGAATLAAIDRVSAEAAEGSEAAVRRIEADVAARRGTAVAGGAACPRCGVATGEGDRFCAACGAPLAAHDPSAPERA